MTGVMERALVAAQKGELSSDQLLAVLAAGEVWVPLPGGAPPSGQSPEGGSVGIPVMMIDGVKYLPVYTSAEEFGQGAGDVAHMVSPLRELARQLPPELGIAVNPGGSIGLPIRPAGVEMLRAGAWTAPAGTQVRLGQPEVEPTELLTALRGTLGRVSEVKSVRSGWAQFGEDPPGVVLGIVLDLDSEQVRQAVQAAVADARGQVPDAPSVNMVFSAASGDAAADGRADRSGDAVAEWLAVNGNPL